MAFNPLRNYARSSVEVTIRLLESIAIVASVAIRLADRTTLERHADMIARGAAKAFLEEADRPAVDACHHSVKQALAGSSGRQRSSP